jgi:Fe-S cluster biosynthesis and repair protein YggX
MCKKLLKELPAMEKAPFGGAVGQMILENVSAEAWGSWKELQIKILNEYRLNMADKKDYQFLIDQMMSFLNLKEGGVAEVENAARGRGNA